VYPCSPVIHRMMHHCLPRHPYSHIEPSLIQRRRGKIVFPLPLRAGDGYLILGGRAGWMIPATSFATFRPSLLELNPISDYSLLNFYAYLTFFRHCDESRSPWRYSLAQICSAAVRKRKSVWRRGQEFERLI
jgi:hypothetical protein